MADALRRVLLLHAFKIHDTHGVPLSLQVAECKRSGYAVSLPAFYRDALRAGWKAPKARAVVEEALVDAGTPRAYVDAALAYLDDVTAESTVLGEEVTCG